MHNKVKDLTSRNTLKKASGYIKDKNGNILFDQEEIAARWVEYITELYEDHREQMPKFEVTSGASIMKDKIQKALTSMKDGKAAGPDELLAEALKALDEQNIEIITPFCNIIYNSGMISTEMKHSVFITLPKKPEVMNCTEFRTISLMSHVTKLLLNIIQQRFTNKIDKEVSRLQRVSDLEQVHEREYLIYGPYVKEQLMYKKMCIYALSITQKLLIESNT